MSSPLNVLPLFLYTNIILQLTFTITCCCQLQASPTYVGADHHVHNDVENDAMFRDVDVEHFHNDVQYGPAHPQPVPDVPVHPHADVHHDVDVDHVVDADRMEVDIEDISKVC